MTVYCENMRYWQTPGICMQTAYNSDYHDVASGSEITPYIKIDKQLVVYRFSGNIMK